MVSAAHNEELRGRQLLPQSFWPRKMKQRQKTVLKSSVRGNVPYAQQSKTEDVLATRGLRPCCTADDAVKGKHFLQTQISWCKSIQEIPRGKVKINLRRDSHKNQGAEYTWEKRVGCNTEGVLRCRLQSISWPLRTYMDICFITIYFKLYFIFCNCFLFLNKNF